MTTAVNDKGEKRRAGEGVEENERVERLRGCVKGKRKVSRAGDLRWWRNE